MTHKFDKLFVFCFALPFVADRLTKHFVISKLWETKKIFSFFNLYLTHNQGIAWGIGNQLNHPHVSRLTILIACVLIYFIWYMYTVAHHRKMITACLFIISGGISNFIDRLWYGSVVDFIQLHYHDWYFPVFNVADISISLGAILLIYFVLFDDQA